MKKSQNEKFQNENEKFQNNFGMKSKCKIFRTEVFLVSPEFQEVDEIQSLKYSENFKLVQELV